MEKSGKCVEEILKTPQQQKKKDETVEGTGVSEIDHFYNNCN